VQPGVPGDGNCDGQVTAADLPALVALVGQDLTGACRMADFDGNGTIDDDDFAATILFEFFVFDRGP
jgi:hypothetical protein